MKTEARFVLAIVLMVGVLVVTNLLFPPVPPKPAAVQDSTGVAQAIPQPAPGLPVRGQGADSLVAPSDSLALVDETERAIVVESPLFRHVFSTHGARLTSTELLAFKSFTRDGAVQLIPVGSRGAFGLRLVVGADTIDLRDAQFTPSRVQVTVGSVPEELTFRHQRGRLIVEVTYTFKPADYLIEAKGTVQGLDRGLLFADVGSGLELNDADKTAESRALAYVGNQLEEGITTYPLSKATEPIVHEGPFYWAAFKSKFFVMAVMPGDAGFGPEQFGGMLVQPLGPDLVQVAVSEPIAGDGRFGYRAFVGPQDNARLNQLGNELDEVNPYSWRFARPMIRPLVTAITSILVFMHNTFNLSYGWVLVLFGLLMRVLLWPLNQKAMRAQAKNMAVQPRMKEIQTKYKDKPEKMQEEMLKLYKETGFNPLAGCLPLLLPWPVLISLYLVFLNTIEFRGVPFFWLPDLSAPDPYYILPLFLGVSMFVLQWMSLKSMPDPNPQMKMMMWMMPIMMVAIFFRFAAGVNLYYAVSNLATIPQQYFIGKERMKTQPPRAPAKKPGG